MDFNSEKIKEILVKENYISEKDAEKAYKNSKKEEISFSRYLFRENIITKEIFNQAIAEYFNVPFVDFKKTKIDERVFVKVPEVVAKARKIIAFYEDENEVRLAMVNPNDLEIRHSIEKKIGKKVSPYYVSEDDLREALNNYKVSLQEEIKQILDQLHGPDLSKEKRDKVIVKIVDSLLQYGYKNKVSDIHIEPYAKKMVVRFRIDGIMHDVLELPKELSEFIVSRIKILAKMRTDEHRVAQDGKLRYQNMDGEMVDVRVSVLPVTEGENVVMRLLVAKNRNINLSDLGFSKDNLKKIKDAITHPHGMILVTGPTGSGKTTTLYSIMVILNKREVHIATIEDPVEYNIEGISQIQVNRKTGLTFAKGLRAIVRQDPDIIMVGEIRDEETADIAVNSAMTGHLVLSTLHTNDAATTLPRLLDMNIEPFLVASTVNVIVAQRLVRKLCEKCRFSSKISNEEKIIVKNDPHIQAAFKKNGVKDPSRQRYYRSTGCNFCGNTGFSGRIGIFEVLEMSENIKQLTLKRASSDEIIAQAQKEGMTSMLEDGISKVLAGITTLDEILRVTRE